MYKYKLMLTSATFLALLAFWKVYGHLVTTDEIAVGLEAGVPLLVAETSALQRPHRFFEGELLPSKLLGHGFESEVWVVDCGSPCLVDSGHVGHGGGCAVHSIDGVDD